MKKAVILLFSFLFLVIPTFASCTENDDSSSVSEQANLNNIDSSEVVSMRPLIDVDILNLFPTFETWYHIKVTNISEDIYWEVDYPYHTEEVKNVLMSDGYIVDYKIVDIEVLEKFGNEIPVDPKYTGGDYNSQPIELTKKMKIILPVDITNSLKISDQFITTIEKGNFDYILKNGESDRLHYIPSISWGRFERGYNEGFYAFKNGKIDASDNSPKNILLTANNGIEFYDMTTVKFCDGITLPDLRKFFLDYSKAKSKYSQETTDGTFDERFY